MNDIKVRTGYYAHAAKYQKNGYLTVSISLITPRWAVPYVEHRIAALAPSQSILDTLPDTETYTRRYREEVLSRLDPKKIYEEEIAHFAKTCGKDKVVLLCYDADILAICDSVNAISEARKILNIRETPKKG